MIPSIRVKILSILGSNLSAKAMYIISLYFYMRYISYIALRGSKTVSFLNSKMKSRIKNVSRHVKREGQYAPVQYIPIS